MNANNGNSMPLTSTATWSLTAVAICACYAAVASLSRFIARTNALRGIPGQKAPGRRPGSSSSGEPSGLHIIFRRGSGITCSSGLPTEWTSSNPKKEFTRWITSGSGSTAPPKTGGADQPASPFETAISWISNGHRWAADVSMLKRTLDISGMPPRKPSNSAISMARQGAVQRSAGIVRNHLPQPAIRRRAG